MAQLWGGRFTKETDNKVFDFNASIRFDKNLFVQDIEGSIAHAVMLGKQGILTLEEKDAIVKGLAGIREGRVVPKQGIVTAKIPLRSRTSIPSNIVNPKGGS